MLVFFLLLSLSSWFIDHVGTSTVRFYRGMGTGEQGMRVFSILSNQCDTVEEWFQHQEIRRFSSIWSWFVYVLFSFVYGSIAAPVVSPSLSKPLAHSSEF